MHGELTHTLQDLQTRVHVLADTLNVEAGKRTLLELEDRMAQPGFWSNNEKAQEVIARVKKLKRETESVGDLARQIGEVLELLELVEEDEDPVQLAELEADTQDLVRRTEELELRTVLSGPSDEANAFLSIHAGAGGTESCDWASMLARMYARFCERQGFQVSVIDVLDGEEAGIRNITCQIKGPHAYGYLQSERGVHRLVRISPFDAKSRRQTSFAAVDVIPEAPETEKDVEIKDGEIRVDTFRAGGAGGQHVNKTDSAVRITHLPTGIVVQCQNERSQHSNRATAMKMLKARILMQEEKKRDAELAKVYGEKNEIAFGSQIRSYTLQPFTLVKDHRTDIEVGNAMGVLDGDLMPFIDGYLRTRRKSQETQPPSKG